MTQKPRRGRPPIGSDRTKSQSILPRLLRSEKDGFSQAAEIAGVPLTVWIRERLRSAARRELLDSSRDVPFLNAGAD